jgi:hypothetical protein
MTKLLPLYETWLLMEARPLNLCVLPQPSYPHPVFIYCDPNLLWWEPSLPCYAHLRVVKLYHCTCNTSAIIRKGICAWCRVG